MLHKMLCSLSVVLFLCFNLINAGLVPLTSQNRDEFVNSHNEWRIRAGATAMMKITWNDGLEKFAQSAALKCQFEHSPQRNNVAGFSYVGEDIYVSSFKPSPKGVVDNWGGEIKDYDLQSNRCSGVCGHYTQVVWSKTSQIGCAIAQCNSVAGFGSGNLVFCNYGIGGNFVGEKPFEKGSPGSKCRQVFNLEKDANGLCAATNQSITPDPKPIKPPQPGGGACEDKFAYCPGWASQCDTFKWLSVYCRKTCKAC